jgi:predicted Holliday junction resolvase-like endonuclease
MIKTILIIVVSVTIFGLVSFVFVRNSLKRKLEMMVIKEKEEFTKNLVKKLDQENKEKELIQKTNEEKDA